MSLPAWEQRFRAPVSYLPHEVYVFETGHGSFDVDERVRQVPTILGFLTRHVPGIRVPDAVAATQSG